jgi:regulator of sirC expression with transglutaminase-like and TPR domain
MSLVATDSLTRPGLSAKARTELQAWSEAEDDLLDLGAVAIAFASLRLPEHNPAVYREHLDRLIAETAELAQRIKPQHVEQQALLLREVIALRHNYRGDLENYNSPDNANLIRVIERRRGLPVALGIVWLHVARGLGWKAEGLGFPEHFLIRLEHAGRRLILDPFHKGDTLGAADLRQRLKSRLGEHAELKPEYSQPVSNKDVLLRLQNNLYQRYARAGLEEEAVEILESMLLFAPDRARLWQTLGLALARMGEEHRAILALENFLTLGGADTERHHAATLLEQLKLLTSAANTWGKT